MLNFLAQEILGSVCLSPQKFEELEKDTKIQKTNKTIYVRLSTVICQESRLS